MLGEVKSTDFGAAAIDQLRIYVASQGESGILLAPFVSPGQREKLKASGLSYWDSTGNLWLRMDQPAVLLDREGTNKNPWVGNRDMRSLKGPAAARVVRAMADFLPPYSLTTLARLSATPPGSVYRVLDLLERESLIERPARGPIADVDWEAILRRWTIDYSLQDSNVTRRFLHPRGVDNVLLRAKDRPDVTFTGTIAASRYLPTPPTRLIRAYVNSIPDAEESLALRQSRPGGISS